MMPVATFLADLRRLGLLEADQLAELERLAADGADSEALAAEVIRRDWLTSFQAREVAAGQGQNLVLDQYVLLGMLGQGGMGAVYKALQRSVKRLVALKIVRREFGISAGALERFHREAEIAAQLSHPNIVTVFDARSADGVSFLVMEFIDGIDLARLVKQRGPLPVAEACDYVRQAALGLQHAHEAGMVHRDIKPHNLMLTRQGVVKVMDLGLARIAHAAAEDSAVSGMTATGMVMGTPNYMAPEQAQDAKSVDIRADIYSLGCTLYHLLAGEPPFAGASLAQMIAAQMFREPAALSTRRADMPPALNDVVARMMAKRPQDRFQTPAEVANVLQQFCPIGTLSDEARRPPLVGSSPPRSARPDAVPPDSGAFSLCPAPSQVAPTLTCCPAAPLPLPLRRRIRLLPIAAVATTSAAVAYGGFLLLGGPGDDSPLWRNVLAAALPVGLLLALVWLPPLRRRQPLASPADTVPPLRREPPPASDLADTVNREAPPPGPWKLPDVVGGYRIGALLGKGDSAEVYLGEHDMMGKAAIKIFRTGPSLPPNRLQRALREAALVGRLKHPQLVPVLHVGEEAHYFYVIMEYMPGGDVTGLIQDQKGVPLPRALEIGRDVAVALEHVHKHGLVHRSVKPSNILLDEAGRARLSNFGSVKPLHEPAAHQLTAAGEIIGTPEYMAPEQARGEPVTPAADRYAFGCLLYYLLSGRDVFSGNPLNVIAQHMYAPPASPRIHEPGIPEPLDDLILELLRKAPGERPADMGAVLSRMDAIGPEAAARGTTSPPSVPRSAPVTMPQFEPPPVHDPKAQRVPALMNLLRKHIAEADLAEYLRAQPECASYRDRCDLEEFLFEGHGHTRERILGDFFGVVQLRQILGELGALPAPGTTRDELIQRLLEALGFRRLRLPQGLESFRREMAERCRSLDTERDYHKLLGIGTRLFILEERVFKDLVHFYGHWLHGPAYLDELRKRGWVGPRASSTLTLPLGSLNQSFIGLVEEVKGRPEGRKFFPEGRPLLPEKLRDRLRGLEPYRNRVFSHDSGESRNLTVPELRGVTLEIHRVLDDLFEHLTEARVFPHKLVLDKKVEDRDGHVTYFCLSDVNETVEVVTDRGLERGQVYLCLSASNPKYVHPILVPELAEP